MTDFPPRSRIFHRISTVGAWIFLSLPLLTWTAAHSAESAASQDVCTESTEGAGLCEDPSINPHDSMIGSSAKGRTGWGVFPAESSLPSSRGEETPVKNAATGVSSETREVVIYFFWGRGCPHCAEEKIFLREKKKQFTHLTIKDFEVWYDKKNAALFSKMAEAYGIKTLGVPVTFVGEDAFSGFSKQLQKEIEEAIHNCFAGNCINPLDKMNKARIPGVKPGLRPSGHAETSSIGNSGEGGEEKQRGKGRTEDRGERRMVTLPLVGKIDPSNVSLPFMTFAIAAMDSFNPCAFFILLSLLGLLVHARSRGKMLLIGGVFVFFSGLIYFLFMAAWLNLFLVMGQVAFITRAAGVVSVLIAVVNMKDFFLFKKGVSLTIPDSAKPKLFDRMRKLMKSTSLPSILVGTSVLAIAANSYELLCTAGFPMVFTRILTLNNLSPPTYYMYLVLYNAVYIVPLAVIVVVFSVSLGTRKLTEWQGRILKLVSGTMMLGLGGVLFLDPSLLNNILASVILLAGSLIVTAVTALLTRRLAALHSSADPRHG